MAVTGFLLCGFLIAHLAGNLTLYADSDGQKFNEYSEELHALGPLVPIAEIGLVALFGLHILLAVATTRRNRGARSSNYEVKRPKKSDKTAVFDPSYLMVLTGIVIFLFLLLHLSDLRFGTFDGESHSRMGEFVKSEAVTATHVHSVLRDPLSFGVYLVASVLLGIHVCHGVASAFQSLGIDNPRYKSWIKCLSISFAFVVGAGFASFPVWALIVQR